MLVPKELLDSGHVPSIGSIEISSEEYINESNNITQEQIYNIMLQNVSYVRLSGSFI